MENTKALWQRPDISAQELHQAISRDRRLAGEVVRLASEITGQADSLARAFIILGVNTIKKITCLISEQGAGRP